MTMRSVDRAIDPTIYPVRDEMGELPLQRFISEVLRQLVEKWLSMRGEQAYVGADTFIYWEKHNPTKSVAPDVYVLPGISQDTDFDVWMTWETGVAPSFAFEIVSGRKGKDYEQAPRRHAELGTRELVVFDPQAPGVRRVRWQVFRRQGRAFVPVEASDADRIRSQVLGCALVVVGSGNRMRVRLASEDGTLVPTAEEQARSAEEQARSAKEQVRKQAEEIEKLRAALRRRSKR